MASVQNSTINFIIDWEGKFQATAYRDGDGITIGWGTHFAKGTEGYYKYLNATIDQATGKQLVSEYLTTVADPRMGRYIRASLNQAQYDAVISYFHNTTFKWHPKLAAVINKHANNLAAGEKEIREVWNEPVVGQLGNGNREVLTGLIARRKAEQDKFFGVLAGDADYYRAMAKKHGKGFYGISSGDTITPASDSNDAVNVEGETTEDETAPIDLQLDFERIANNIRNLELDNVDNVIWGQRTNDFEDTDWIGLRQYLLYLTTTYYPQALVPFVELIPMYKLDLPESTLSKERDVWTDKLLNDDTLTQAQKDELFKKINSDDRTLLNYRYNKTSERLNQLTESGGLDLLNIDPFQETSSAFNIPNNSGKLFEKEKGYSYRIYGMIGLNPRIVGDEISKAGSIGFTHMEFDSGSQAQNNMSLVTIKIRDVQGNKLLDVNSPWSFILNSRPGMIGGDFYFRFGWQVRVPPMNPDGSAAIKDDLSAVQFWKHPGWELFGEGTKTMVSNLASAADNSLVFTQSSAMDSFTTLGYKNVEGHPGVYELDRKLEPATVLTKYMQLVLVNPEINVNPEDGSVEATLMFRTAPAVANLLCPIHKCQNVVDLINNNSKDFGGGTGFFSWFGKKKGVRTNMRALMEAYIKDNQAYTKDVTMTDKVNKFKVNAETNTTPDPLDNFLTIIGGNGMNNQVELRADGIPILITNELAGELNRAYENKDNSQLLLTWINKVLQENGCTTLAAGDQAFRAGDPSGTIVIYYDKETISEGLKEEAKEHLISQAKESASRVVADDIYKEFLNTRLQEQDDVFSFRFRGSLVEGISVDKLETPTLQKLQSQQTMAQGTEANANDTGPASSDTQTSQNDIRQSKIDRAKAIRASANASDAQLKIAERLEDEASKMKIDTKVDASGLRIDSNSVTYKDKMNALNILYASMLGASVKCIGHPWIRIGKAIGIKGTGFFDGKYVVTKVKHSLDENNKFVTDINACRLVNQADSRTKNAAIANQQKHLQNHPGVGYTSPAGKGSKSGAMVKPTYVDNTYVKTPSGVLVAAANLASSTTTKTKLATGNKKAVPQFLEFIKKMKDRGYDVEITSCGRTYNQQNGMNNSLAVAGVGSIHLYGLAFDCNILLNGKVVAGSLAKYHNGDVNACVHAWKATGAIDVGESLNLVWGGDFAEFDPVHFGWLQNRSYSGRSGTYVVNGKNCFERLKYQLGFDPLNVNGWKDKLWSLTFDF